MEFIKGILFIRLKGDVSEETVKDAIREDFKYIVLNINNMYSIDSYSINYLTKIYKNSIHNKGKIILCDKFNISNKLLKDIPKVTEEYDAFKIFERMI